MKSFAEFLIFCISLTISLCVSAQANSRSNISLQALLDDPNAGELIQLSAGVYQGNFVINRSLTLRGGEGVIIDALGKNDGIRVKAKDVTIENLSITNWGDDLTLMNAGIFVEKTATNIRIENNYLKGSVTGIWLDKCEHALVMHNRIEGNLEYRSVDRGNGIHLSMTKNARIEANEVWHVRDGIYINASQHNKLIGNRLHDLRYGIHYMYSYHNQVSNNYAYNVKAGYALMQSKFLQVHNNVSENSHDYGILLNFITNSHLSHNHVIAAKNKQNDQISGAQGKALFVYNSLNNRVERNIFTNSDIGIHLTAGSENNVIVNNSFEHNLTQVKYVANREQEWSENQSGNYWSNYLGWDLDNDQIGDTTFEPNDGVDRLLWKFPQAKLLMDSPSILLVRWVQKQFPVFKAQGVKDSYPLMSPPYQKN